MVVAYKGILPDLFREGQGVVTEGQVGADGMFSANSVLAKHDEKYMPREVVDALKAQGVWGKASGPAARDAVVGLEEIMSKRRAINTVTRFTRLYGNMGLQ